MRQFDRLDHVHEWLDTNQAKPPNAPGIYFIYYSAIGGFGPFCDLIYIGSSKNLRKRLSPSHNIIKQFKKGILRITYCEVRDYRELEKLAIARFCPLANINHINKD